MTIRSRLGLASSLTVLLAAGTAHAQCTGDVSNDGLVDVRDMLLVIGAWGECEDACPEDVTEDGVVDVSDLLTVLADWGPCRFEYTGYENEYAEFVGIAYVGRNGPLLLDEAVYNRVDHDMRLIEQGWPELAGGPHFGPWVPYHMLIGVDTKVPRDELDELAAYFRAEVTREWFGGSIIMIEFPHPININAAIPLFEELVPVEYAEPDQWRQLPGATPGWFVEDVGQGAAQWTVVVPWTEGAICDPEVWCCACWTEHTFLTLPDGSVNLLDVRAGSYDAPFCQGEDCNDYR